MRLGAGGDDEDGALRGFQDAGGDAAGEQFVEGAVAVRAEDDDAGVLLNAFVKDFFDGRALDVKRDHLDAILCQILLLRPVVCARCETPSPRNFSRSPARVRTLQNRARAQKYAEAPRGS